MSRPAQAAGSSRLKLIVAYDGAPFAGWQSQAHGGTVQDHLEKVFQRITNQVTRVHGAGRTDAGVHALGQCAHADVPKNQLTPERWITALNGHLPPALRILGCRIVPESFHAQYSAKGKVYRYRIWNGPVLPPLENGRAWHIARPLDPRILQTAAQRFTGRHDFAAFAARRGKSKRKKNSSDSEELDTVRTIRSVKLRKRGQLFTIEFEGDGFLYKMVRMLVAAAVQCAQGKITLPELSARLAAGRRAQAGLVAPAAGLFLIRVRY